MEVEKSISWPVLELKFPLLFLKSVRDEKLRSPSYPTPSIHSIKSIPNAASAPFRYLQNKRVLLNVI